MNKSRKAILTGAVLILLGLTLMPPWNRVGGYSIGYHFIAGRTIGRIDTSRWFVQYLVCAAIIWILYMLAGSKTER